jgi:hypothetical protein
MDRGYFLNKQAGPAFHPSGYISQGGFGNHSFFITEKRTHGWNDHSIVKNHRPDLDGLQQMLKTAHSFPPHLV